MNSTKIEAAVRDLERHTLAGLPGKLAKLVYLASTRDYDTGQYHHAGLAQTYTSEAAQAALPQCHSSVFDTLAYEGIEALVEEIRAYLDTRGEHAQQVLETWRALEPYRMLVPAGCDAQLRDLFVSNFIAALAVVRSKDPQYDLPTEPQLR